MSVKQPKKPSRFNYSLMIRILLSMLCGNLRFHVNLINAAAGCRKYSKDKFRIVAMDGTNNSTYLTCMKNEERNAPEAIRVLFRTGEYDDVMHKKPCAELFQDITYGHIIFKHDDDELIFRETIREALMNGDNSHMTEKEINDLITSSKEDDIAIFIFNCIYTAVMCKGNTSQRNVSKTDLAEIEAETMAAVNNMTEAEKEAARTWDDTTENT